MHASSSDRYGNLNCCMADLQSPAPNTATSPSVQTQAPPAAAPAQQDSKLPPKKRRFERNCCGETEFADTKIDLAGLRRATEQACGAGDFYDSDDEVFADAEQSLRSAKTRKPVASIIHSIAEPRKPRIGDRFQAVVPDFFPSRPPRPDQQHQDPEQQQ